MIQAVILVRIAVHPIPSRIDYTTQIQEHKRVFLRFVSWGCESCIVQYLLSPYDIKIKCLVCKLIKEM